MLIPVYWSFFPPRGFDGESVSELFFSVFWLSFTGAWTLSAINGGAPVPFAALSLPFWGVGLYLLTSALKELFMSEELYIGSTEYFVSTYFLAVGFSREHGLIADLSGPPQLFCDGDDDGAVCQLVLQDGIQEYVFGSNLRRVEAKWLQKELKEYLGKDASALLGALSAIQDGIAEWLLYVASILIAVAFLDSWRLSLRR